jgi:hypothetical protein
MIRGCEMSLEDGLRLEYASNSYLTQTEGHEKGKEAFVEKKKPVYKGK